MMGHENKPMLILLLLLYVAATTYIGFRFRKSQSSEDYFLASRRMPAWLLSITFIASWWGGGSAIDLMDHANTSGISTFWIYGVPVLLATGLMYLFAGAIRRASTITQPEIMESRYDRRTAFMLTLFIVIFMVLGSAVQVIVIGLFFQSFFGVSYALGATVGTLAVLTYSLFGGFRGVVLTDLLQFVFFLFAALFLFGLAYTQARGFEGLSHYLEQSPREGYRDFMHNIGDNIAYVVTFGTSWMIQANVWQRISAASSPRAAKRMMALSFLLFIPLYLIVTLTGMLSLPIFGSLPERGVVATMLLNIESPILSGVIFVGLCSAIMSTMDSMLNTGALSLTIDIYKRYLHPTASAESYVKVGRLMTIAVGLVALFIGLKIDSVLTISWIGADFIATGAFVPLVLGFLWRRATSTAALSSMIFGLIFSSYNMAVALGAPLPVGWEIASSAQAIIGITTSLIIFVVVTLCSKAEYEKADKFIRKTDIFGSKEASSL